MVSTRGYKYKFAESERVLCFEPDLKKAKVLYDSKVRQIIEAKDKKGRKQIEYLIHFQGWSSSWDRRVCEEFVLKDTEENRKLQKELAEKAQLLQGGFLYRKERKKRMRRKLSDRIDNILGEKIRSGSSDSFSGGERNENDPHDEFETDYSSSIESTHEDDKIVLQIGAILKKVLENDYHFIKSHKLTNLPAQMPVWQILENFVRHYTIKLICGPTSDQPQRRRRNSHAVRENKVKEHERMQNSVDLCKEVADGLRIYFDFTLKDYLLYNEEREQYNHAMSEEFRKTVKLPPYENLIPDFLSVIKQQDSPEGVGKIEETSQSTGSPQKVIRHRLRSRNDENEFMFDLGSTVPKVDNLSSVASTSSEGMTSNPQITSSTAALSTSINILKSILPLNIGISSFAKELLDSVFAWRMLPDDGPFEASHIYGAVHLARLVVKLPEFLSVSAMPDDKLTLLLTFLDPFIEYLEDHEEFFGNHLYDEFDDDQFDNQTIRFQINDIDTNDNTLLADNDLFNCSGNDRGTGSDTKEMQLNFFTNNFKTLTKTEEQTKKTPQKCDEDEEKKSDSIPLSFYYDDNKKEKPFGFIKIEATEKSPTVLLATDDVEVKQ